MDYEQFVYSIVGESTFLKFDDRLFMSMVLWMAVSIASAEAGKVIIISKDSNKHKEFDSYEKALDYIRRYERQDKRKAK